jgi:hypothetical protein
MSALDPDDIMREARAKASHQCLTVEQVREALGHNEAED